MLRRINGKIRYTKKCKKVLNSLKPYKGGEWDLNNIKFIKSIIRSQLDRMQQGHCAYCGLNYNETSGSEIEHIAPKGGAIRPRHVEFTFVPYNLVLSCHLCNSPRKKGLNETLINKARNYKDCQFNIVHPYFDSPDDHFDWITNGDRILISFKTPKGQKSIEIFELDSTIQSEARAKQVLFEMKRNEENIESIIQQALTYRQ